MAFIGCGKCKFYYIYIFVLILFKFVSDYIEGFNDKEYKDYTLKKYVDETFIDFCSLFGYHPLIRNLVYFLSSILCGLILYIVYLKTEGDRDGSISIERVSSLRSQIFGESSSRCIFFDMILTSFIYILNILLRTFLGSLRFDAGFWTLEILCIIYLSIKILKIKIGNHQKVAIIILAVISFSLQIVNSLLPKTDHGCKNSGNEEECLNKYISDNNTYVFIAKKFGHVGWVFLILFFYILHFTMRDYSWVRLKYLMDIKSKPMFKVLLYIGIIGTVIILISLIIATNFPYEVMENVIIKNNSYYDITNNETINFEKEISGLIVYNETTKKLTFYYDSYNIFFKDFAQSNRKTIEIIIIPIYFLINIIINFSSVMILKNVDANAMLFNINVNYLLSRMILYIKHKGSKEYLTVVEFVLLELCEILAILAYMIYIELIELNFCELDYHLKKKIEQRGITDSKLFLDENDDEINDPTNVDDEKNENNENNENNNENNDDNPENEGEINDIKTEENIN